MEEDCEPLNVGRGNHLGMSTRGRTGNQRYNRPGSRPPRQSSTSTRESTYVGYVENWNGWRGQRGQAGRPFGHHRNPQTLGDFLSNQHEHLQGSAYPQESYYRGYICDVMAAYCDPLNVGRGMHSGMSTRGRTGNQRHNRSGSRPPRQCSPSMRDSTSIGESENSDRIFHDLTQGNYWRQIHIGQRGQACHPFEHHRDSHDVVDVPSSQNEQLQSSAHPQDSFYRGGDVIAEDCEPLSAGRGMHSGMSTSRGRTGNQRYNRPGSRPPGQCSPSMRVSSSIGESENIDRRFRDLTHGNGWRGQRGQAGRPFVPQYFAALSANQDEQLESSADPKDYYSRGGIRNSTRGRDHTENPKTQCDDDDNFGLSRPNQNAGSHILSQSPITVQRGRVVAVVSDGGYIKPKNIDTMVDSESNRVRYYLDRMSCGYMKPIPGDIVEYIPSAMYSTTHKVSVVEFKHRDLGIWTCYLKNLNRVMEQTEILPSSFVRTMDKDIMHIPKKLSRSQFLACVAECTPLWKAMCSEREFNDHLIELILQFVDQVPGDLCLKIIDTITSYNSLRRISGAFKSYVENVAAQHTHDETPLLFKFIMRVLQQRPGRAQTVVKLMKPLVVSSICTMCRAFYDGFLEATKHFRDEDTPLDWNELPLTPSTAELDSGPIGADSGIRPVHKTGPYSSAEEYIDTYFRLLREDCFHPLKKGLENLRAGQLDSRDMNIYHDVTFCGIIPNKEKSGIYLMLQFDHKETLGGHSKLAYGNLLCMSVSGTFSDVIWASVSNAIDDQHESMILVELVDGACDKDDTTLVMQLVNADNNICLIAESPTYYKSYQPVMEALQRINPDTMPFIDELVNLASSSSPEYVTEDSVINRSTLVVKKRSKHETHDYTRQHSHIEYSSGSETEDVDDLEKESNLTDASRVVKSALPSESLAASNISEEENHPEQYIKCLKTLQRTNVSITTDHTTLKMNTTCTPERFKTLLETAIIKKHGDSQMNETQVALDSEPKEEKNQLEENHEGSNPSHPADTSHIETNVSKFKLNVKNIAEVRLKIESETSIFDDKQKVAVEKALSNRVAIIQGPPGTGKTYIGIRLLNVLFSMSTIPKGPVLLLTYKNHALDEFLKGTMKHITDKVVRVGGRSKEKILKEFNLKNKIKQPWQDRDDTERCFLMNAIQSLKNSFSWNPEVFIKYLNNDQLWELIRGCHWQKTQMYDSIYNQPTAKQVEGYLNYMDPLNESLEHHENSERQNVLKILLQTAADQWVPRWQNDNLIEKYRPEKPKSLHVKQDMKNGKKTKDEIEKGMDDIKEEEKNETENYRNATRGDVENDQLDEIKKLVGNLRFPTKHNKEMFPTSLPCTWEKMPNSSTKSLWIMNNQEKAIFVQIIMKRNFTQVCSNLRNAIQNYKHSCMIHQGIVDNLKIDVLREQKVIGMTITGASMHRNLLEKVQPAIVIVEEAAEVLEPQIIAALGEWTKHLILIGDHKQLRPAVESYILVTKYGFDLSMMERLIINGFDYTTLDKQNRMRPEFAELLLDIYPSLESNLERVKNRTPPSCIAKAMYFWHHTDPEKKERSYTNINEAKRVVQLVLYLVQNGHSPNSITVISAYRGQTAVLRRLLREAVDSHKHLFTKDSDINILLNVKKQNGKMAKKYCKQIAQVVKQQSEEESLNDPERERPPVDVSTIDMYQGDENDIIIISLVRSNEEAQLGFLKTVNRRCVSQSRAKCAMYFLGNVDVLKTNRHWARLIEKMDDAGCVGPSIPLCCPYHRDIVITAATANDIKLDVYCNLQCNIPMPCGRHTCKQNCQPFHKHEVCKFDQPFTQECGHVIVRPCWQSRRFVKCQTPVTVKLEPCGHEHVKACYIDQSIIQCKIMCTIELLKCGHMYTKECHINEKLIECKEKCLIKLKCGHEHEKECYVDENSIQCNVMCTIDLPICGHAYTKECHVNEKLIKCEEKCLIKLRRCGHMYEKICHYDEDRIICNTNVQVKLQPCEHLFEKTCHENQLLIKCPVPCSKILACSHPCPLKCGFPCPTDKALCPECVKISKEEEQQRLVVEQQQRDEAFRMAKEELKKLKKKRGTGIYRVELKPPKPGEDGAKDYYEIFDLAMGYIKPGHNWFPEITTIEKITNIKLEAMWREAQLEMSDPLRSASKFIHTTRGRLRSIVEDGLDMPQNRSPPPYGDGIYFDSDSTKHTQDLSKRESDVLVLCDVLLGAQKTVWRPDSSISYHSLWNEWCDSVYAPRSQEKERETTQETFVIFNAYQALPRYIVHYNVRKVTVASTFETLAQLEKEAMSTSQIKRHVIESKRCVDYNDPLEIHFRIAESQFLRVRRRSMKECQLVSVEYCISPVLLQRFMDKAAELEKKSSVRTKPILVFHGTKTKNIDNILENNFDMKKANRGKFGRGIYFSEFPDYSAAYSDKTNKLLLCKILPGKEFECSMQDRFKLHLDDKCKPGYDSHICRINRQSSQFKEEGDEIVIFNTDQILPCYVLNYKHQAIP